MSGVIVDKAWRIDPESLVARRVRAARMLVVALASERDAVSLVVQLRRYLVILDADSDEFVLVQDLPELRWAEFVSLSDDGTRMVGLGTENRLFVHTLATGETRWLNRQGIDGHVMGAFSPDGSRLAALTMVETGQSPGEGEHRIAVEVMGLEDGSVQTVWRGEGFWAEWSLAWSPDARLLVWSCLSLDEERNVTHVLELATGRVVADFEDRVPMANPHGVWLGPDAFVAFSEIESDVAVIELDRVAGRSRERVSRRTLPDYLGVCDGRYVRSSTYRAEAGVAEMHTTDLEGNDPRLFLTISAKVEVEAIDIPSRPRHAE